MSRDEIRRLLGGYETGNLTESERRALLTAALDDQDLFDALAREQPLADLLADSQARARLLAALAEPPKRPWPRLWPAIAASAALAAIVLVVLFVPRAAREETKPVQVAEARKEPAPVPAPPAAAPVPPRPKPRTRSETRPAPEAVRDEATPAMAQAEADSAAPALPMRRSALTRSALSLAETPPVTVLRLKPDGHYESVPANAIVRVGEAIRLRIQPAAAGFLQVAEHEGQVRRRPVFSGMVEPGRVYLVPADGPVYLEHAGTKEVVISVAAGEDQHPRFTRRVTIEVTPARSREANP